MRDQGMQSVRRMIVPTALYFAILAVAILVAGWAHMGLKLVGVSSELAASAEALIIAFALLPGSGFLIRAFDVPPNWRHRLGLGVGAVVLWLLLDMAIVPAVGRHWTDVFETHVGTAVGPLHSAALAFAALVPLIRQRT